MVPNVELHAIHHVPKIALLDVMDRVAHLALRRAQIHVQWLVQAVD